jgi:hypothetical protein
MFLLKKKKRIFKLEKESNYKEMKICFILIKLGDTFHVIVITRHYNFFFITIIDIIKVDYLALAQNENLIFFCLFKL